MSLQTLASDWLAGNRHCLSVLFEFSPLKEFHGKPDVVGITQSRHMIEVEIKRSLNNFNGNTKKRCMAEHWRRENRTKFPREFWFLVPNVILEQVVDLVPPYAGLIAAESSEKWLRRIVDAPINNKSKPLDADQCAAIISHHFDYDITRPAPELTAGRLEYGRSAGPRHRTVSLWIEQSVVDVAKSLVRSKQFPKCHTYKSVLANHCRKLKP